MWSIALSSRNLLLVIFAAIPRICFFALRVAHYYESTRSSGSLLQVGLDGSILRSWSAVAVQRSKREIIESVKFSSVAKSQRVRYIWLPVPRRLVRSVSIMQLLSWHSGSNASKADIDCNDLLTLAIFWISKTIIIDVSAKGRTYTYKYANLFKKRDEMLISWLL